MPRYRITTLVDITRTGFKKSDLDQHKINQQHNFNSIRQAIELRSNVTWNIDPAKKIGALPGPFEGKAAYWIWEFETEREDLFLKDGDPVLLLKEDLNSVPIINGLEETVDLSPAAVITKGKTFNTFVEIIR
jgi:hypothetical protein